jgi:light-regulated signal transduction histidine kinase (bacteriophytochrome)
MPECRADQSDVRAVLLVEDDEDHARAISEWNLLMERKYTKSELKKFFNNLNEANCNLDDLLESMSRDLDESINAIRRFNNILLEKYADKLDESSRNELKRCSDSAQRADELLNRLFENAIPVFFYSSLIEIYSEKLSMLNNDGVNSD